MSIGWCGIPPLCEPNGTETLQVGNHMKSSQTHCRHNDSGGNHGLNSHEVRKVEAMILAGENRDFICRAYDITRAHLAWIAERIKPEGK